MTRGIDVSKYQGRIDWLAVKEAGYSFALLRSSFGWDNEKQIDPSLNANISGCEAAGLDWGCYHYSYAEDPEDAAKEAAFFLRVIRGHKPTFPVWFDFEEPMQVGGSKNGKSYAGYPLEKQVQIIEAFLRPLEAAGYFAGLYMSASPLKRLLDYAPERIGKYAFWVAQWSGDACDIAGVGVWQNAVIGRQGTRGVHFTSLGDVPGVSTNCDVNIAYRDYSKLIRENGLNGWGEGKTDTELPDMVTRVEYEALKARYDGLVKGIAALMEKYKG